jgi:hypothetical protein
VDAGGTVSAEAVAQRLGWRITSAQDSLANLAAREELVKAGIEPRTRCTIWELRGPDTARTKTCRACAQTKPEGAFFFSRAAPDGLTAICRNCIRGNAERDRVEREARRAL